MTGTISRKPFIFGIILLVLLLGGAVPAFSQQALTSFTLGYESSRMDGVEDSQLNMNTSGMIFAANVLFVGGGGLTVSAGAEFVTDFYAFVHPAPVIGIGYVFYNRIYFGGILNVIPRHFDTYTFGGSGGDGILAPTLVAGLDFGNFLVEARGAYMHGFGWHVSGFRFSLGVGVNIGSGALE